MSGDRYVYANPPGGHNYGFPKRMHHNDDYETFLRENGYPEKHIPFALKYSTFLDGGLIEKEDVYAE